MLIILKTGLKKGFQSSKNKSYFKMKKLFLLFLLTFNLLFSQDKLEKSFTALEVGLFGISLSNESRLSQKFTIKSSFNLGLAIWKNDRTDEVKPSLVPVLTVMPKYYYNLNRRMARNKRIKYNSANYFALEFNYTPSWFVISNIDGNLRKNENISIIPKYGFRRNINNSKFNYELNFGLGYMNHMNYYIKKEDNHEVFPGLEFKLAYTF